MKRVLILSLLLFFAVPLWGQVKKKKSPSYNKGSNPNSLFLQKQWWIGLKAGLNLSSPTVEKNFYVISPVNYPLPEKKYDSFKQWGRQIGLDATFFYRNFSVSVQPTYQHSRFNYSTEFSWTDPENGSNRLDLTYDQVQKIDHIIIPLVLKYELGNVLKPYVQVGGFSALLINANKEVTTSGTDFASGGERAFSNEPVIVGAKDLFAKVSYGLMGGAGVYYNIGNIRLNFDVQYKHWLTNINSAKNRYNNDRLSGIGDAMDDLTLQNISVSVGTLFPLRFLSSGFKSVDTK